VRNVLKNKLNIGREIVIMRCQRVFNGSDAKGNRPIVVNFQKWSDKEEILRKSKILQSSGLSVTEDFSRAAKRRRRELEKLVKEVRAADPERKCAFKYDKLLIDGDVFVFNDLEGRIERLPLNVSGQSSHLEHDHAIGGDYAVSSFGGSAGHLPSLLSEDTPSATLGKSGGRPRTNPNSVSTTNLLAAQQASRPAWRTKSVESILSKIPDVSSGSLGEEICIPAELL